MKKELIEREMEKSIVVATYQSISEGISIEQLNTVVFASPKRDVVQALGRIFRKVHTDVHPIIVDISDRSLSGQERARLCTYRQELNGNLHVTYYDEFHQKIAEIASNKASRVPVASVPDKVPEIDTRNFFRDE